MMLLRLNGFLSRLAGVTPALCRLPRRPPERRLGARRARGPYGAAGEIGRRSPTSSRRLSAKAAVEDDGASRRRALARRGVAPFEPAAEGGHRAPQRIAVRDRTRYRRLLAGLVACSAARRPPPPSRSRSPAARRGRTRRVRHARRATGPGEVRARPADGAARRRATTWATAQSPVSFRVVPQVHGACSRGARRSSAARAAARSGHRHAARPRRRGRRAERLLPDRRFPRRRADARCSTRSPIARLHTSSTWSRSGSTASSTPASRASPSSSPSTRASGRRRRATQGASSASRPRRRCSPRPRRPRARHVDGPGGRPGVHVPCGRAPGALARRARGHPRLRARRPAQAAHLANCRPIGEEVRRGRRGPGRRRPADRARPHALGGHPPRPRSRRCGRDRALTATRAERRTPGRCTRRWWRVSANPTRPSSSQRAQKRRSCPPNEELMRMYQALRSGPRT